MGHSSGPATAETEENPSNKSRISWERNPHTCRGELFLAQDTWARDPLLAESGLYYLQTFWLCALISKHYPYADICVEFAKTAIEGVRLELKGPILPPFPLCYIPFPPGEG